MRTRRAILLLLPALPLAGCTGLADVAPEAAGLGAGAGAGVLTANPLIGVAVGLGVRLATDEAIGAVEKSHQRDLHRVIANAAGSAPPGVWARWSTDPSTVNDLLFGTISGSVQVVRDFGGRIRCREILYFRDKDGGLVGLVDDAGREADTAADDVVDGAAAHGSGRQADQPAGDDMTGAIDITPARVRVAVICRDRSASRWTWAVSAPGDEED